LPHKNKITQLVLFPKKVAGKLPTVKKIIIVTSKQTQTTQIFLKKKAGKLPTVKKKSLLPRNTPRWVVSLKVQHTAMHCNALQRTATHAPTHCNTL